MENNFQKTINSVLKGLVYFALWALALNSVLFGILWIFSGWKFDDLIHHPLLSPWKNIRLWFVGGIIYGFAFRYAKPLNFFSWGRAFLYMLFFTVFISALQTWYVHRKNTGWYDMAGTNRCYNKYHSFWLIQDKEYFKGIDECLKNKKAQEAATPGFNSYTKRNYTFSNSSTIKTQLIEYDTITPRLLWVLIAFILITLIEYIRRLGPVGFYKAMGKLGSKGRNQFRKLNNGNSEFVLLGAIANLVFLAFLPKINGFPSQTLPVYLGLAILFFAFRISVSKKLLGSGLGKNYEHVLMILIGALISNILLAVLGVKLLYYLIIISLGAYLVVSKKAPKPAVQVIVIILFFLDPFILWADDGTWSSGGIGTLLNDSAGPLAVDNAESLSETVSVTVPFATDPPTEDEEVSLTEEEIMGANTDSNTTTTSEKPKPTMPFDRPLGEEPPGTTDQNP